MKLRAPVALCLLLETSAALAWEAPPWIHAGDVPLPVGVRSVRPRAPDVPVLLAPDAASVRRGVLAFGATLPLFGLLRGPGCAGRWLNIGPLAWTCQDRVELTSLPALSATEQSYQPSADGLPSRYFFVGKDGTYGYSRLEFAGQTMPDEELEAGFAVAVIAQQDHDDVAYSMTTQGLWIPTRDLVPVHPPAFHGEILVDSTLDFAWAVSDTIPLLSAPSLPARTRESLVRFQLVRVLETKRVGAETYYRVSENRWVRAREMRRPSVAPPPDGLRIDERWIDIDLSSQTLVAWEGNRAAYATLVSTGKGLPGSSFATPIGAHRIWVKLLASSMDNLEQEDAEDHYSMQDVPYVQYFREAVGLHATFWHNKFGHVRSHGCVNLAPLDAQWLFAWTRPHLPAGWTAVFPTDLEPGTLIRVR